ncbi:MAG: GNAT family N-acetyltransferase [Defluviitaleaceae bacterium]|nr:GNAT family N-acetyltransferase [Defluviitaleaceae bacterium]
MLILKWFFGDTGLEDAYGIRQEVFVQEQNVSEAEEYDGTDASCIHLVAYENTIPVATGRIMISGDDFVIGRVAVLKSHRGQNLGLGIMQALIDACYTMGGETQRQTLHAQTHARGFYEKLGFTAYGDTFIEANIPHIAMERYGPAKCCKGITAQSTAPQRRTEA